MSKLVFLMKKDIINPTLFVLKTFYLSLHCFILNIDKLIFFTHTYANVNGNMCNKFTYTYCFCIERTF